MPKKTLNIEESEVADALRMLSKGDKITKLLYQLEDKIDNQKINIRK